MYLSGQGEGGTGAAGDDDEGEEDAALVRSHPVNQSTSQGARDDVARGRGGRERGREGR
jgi:hypothetical protein